MSNNQTLALVGGAGKAPPPRARKLQPNLARIFAYIAEHVKEHGHFPKTVDTVRHFENGDITSWGRGQMVVIMRRLEKKGFIARTSAVKGRGIGWHTHGVLTEHGAQIAKMLPHSSTIVVRERPGRIGGGLAEDGGTHFKRMLFSVRDFPGKLIPLSDKYSKLGSRVEKGALDSKHRGRLIATFSLEEGRTCSPTCGMRDQCYAGKMARQKRILYEGVATDEAMLRALADTKRKPRHIRLNTVGDFPTKGFVDAILLGLMQSGSTAFGYTHWEPECKLGAYVRRMSHLYWDFFAVRTSYEHGSREPLPERAAVVVDDFDPKILALHNAAPCPEQTGDAKDCGSCGFCWNSKKNVAFKRH